MVNLNNFLDFLKLLVVTTFSQLIWLLGLFFIFGLILYLFARFTRVTFVKSAGRKLDIFITGWIGTPVHELGHAIFCVLFGHKIKELKLYSPNAADGTLGFVHHAYNPKSTYQKIGNFFIGAGPIIFGSLVIYAISYYLVPDMRAVFSGIESQGEVYLLMLQGQFSGVLEAFWQTTQLTLGTLLNRENFSDYRFWIFLYLAVSISSHMQLSPPDISGAKSGLISLVVLFFILNLLILGMEATGLSVYFGDWWQFIKLEHYAVYINNFLGVMASLFVFASIISGLNFVASYIILTLYNLIRGKGLINPVR
ncbi:MAG: hypothetical protein RG741_06505 [Bacteroidales bacterium]|nr:hypothetical protein [Bacteroidales bacterium]